MTDELGRKILKELKSKSHKKVYNKKKILVTV